MPNNPPDGYQRIIPYLNYAGAPAAIEFLCEAFGFEERMRLPMPDGRLGHAELVMGDNVLMLASNFEEMDHATPRELGKRHGAVMCYVDDVDAHHERAKAAGAEIVQELEDKFYGDRSYSALDIEGQYWTFGTHVRDVSEEEMQEAIKNM